MKIHNQLSCTLGLQTNFPVRDQQGWGCSTTGSELGATGAHPEKLQSDHTWARWAGWASDNSRDHEESGNHQTTTRQHQPGKLSLQTQERPEHKSGKEQGTWA